MGFTVKKIILAGMLVLLAACHADSICLVPITPPPAASGCPKEKPYINKWHPGMCFADPQPPESQP